ncbi:MAG: hypothetical protein PV344_02935, partial [Anaplasma sp.]|nr:hypothetical protein [Anaplasma sp.]
RRFILGFANIASPLSHLLSRNVSYKWTPDCQFSFDTLRKVLSSGPILSTLTELPQLNYTRMPVELASAPYYCKSTLPAANLT